ncbi:MAG: RIP metalloprotease RseP [Bacteriovoracaceae bacterium]|nr:RIP metalloprotease RseP [Bacteriovoracaceae bacterium]
MYSVLIFLVFLGPLVFFHELGHFLFARLFGVRVETFSIGFGPKLFRFKKGDTEYVISLIPLGGYVKMFGDDPLKKDEVSEELRSVAFTHKTKWQRFWIVFGGPLANFLLAFTIYFFLTIGGEKVPEPKIGLVPKDSKYFALGLRTGDVLSKINSKEILSFDDLNLVDHKITSFEVKRKGQSLTFPITDSATNFITDLMTFRQQLRLPIVVNQKGETFIISRTQGQVNWNDSFELIQEEVNISLYLYPVTGNLEEKGFKESADFKNERAIKVKTDPTDTLRKQGYFALDLKVLNIVPDSPASKAGLASGDILLTISNKVINSFEQLRDELQKQQVGQEIKINFLREGKEQEIALIPEVRTEKETTIKTIGVYSGAKFVEFEMVESPPRGIFESIHLSFLRTLDGIAKTFNGLMSLVLGQVSVKNIGGPLLIGKAATDSLDISLSYFFRLMAIISINLGLINLFPIPVLDGGHILFLLFEAVKRGPMSKKTLELAHQFGFSILMFLVGYALYNDIVRIIQN